MRTITLGFLLSATLLAGPAPITVRLGGPESAYTPLLVKLLEQWPPRTIDFNKIDPAKVQVRCLETPGKEFFIGIEQAMLVRGELARVERFLEDVDHYKDYFTEFDDIHAVSREENLMTVFWEHNVPFPLVPNTKYETYYVIERSRPERRVYRYKLKEATKDMHTADGIIVIERAGPQLTRYVEYDFWDGEYGIAKTLAPKRIWRDSVEETYLSDAAIKVKAEHPDWPAKQVVKEAKKLMDDKDIDSCLANKTKFFLLP